MAFSKGLTEEQWRDLYKAHVVNPGGARTPEGEQALINYWVRDAADRSEAEHLTTSASMFVQLATRNSISEFRVIQLIEGDLTHLRSGVPIVGRNA